MVLKASVGTEKTPTHLQICQNYCKLHTLRANSCFCDSNDSCTSNICLHFSSRRVEGEAFSSATGLTARPALQNELA